MDAAAEAPIGNDVLAADDPRVAQNADGDEPQVLDEVGGVADATTSKEGPKTSKRRHFAIRSVRSLPSRHCADLTVIVS